MQAENPDIYAWIRIADTPIDYPILQKEGDDDYYLYRTVDGEEGLPGSIMTEYSYNPHAFSEDPVTVVYGHNMLNDSFFSRLKDFQDETFRKEHETIEIYTPEHIYVITNERTFSAAFHYTFYLWKMGATLVGIPSGQAPIPTWNKPYSGYPIPVCKALSPTPYKYAFRAKTGVPTHFIQT